MNEKGLMEQLNAAIKAALELYAADHGKLNDGDSFTTKLNNCIFRDGEESYDGEIYHGKTKFITWDGIGVPDDIDSAMQMVIGEFVCDDIRRIGPEYCVVKEDIESAISGSCLTVPQVKDYAGWKSGMSYADLKDLYGWHISDLKIYDRPRPLSDFTRLRATKFGYEPVEIRRPPQSWFYVEDAECTS